MSFNFNGPSFRPMIQESQSMQNNGGGGNTGYFRRGKKKKDKDIDVFNTTDENDSFVPSSADNEENNDKDGTIIDKLAQKAKGFVEKLKPQENQKEANPFQENED